MNYANKRTSKAFTLIELSIVVVIIGLIVAGVVAGQSLVHQAKLKSVSTDLAKFETAFNSFRLQYNAMPGDVTNAWSYWRSACGNNVQANCNGDGDNIIDISGGASVREDTIAWQHLSLAGLIPGSWTWESNNTILGQNIIPAGINNAG